MQVLTKLCYLDLFPSYMLCFVVVTIANRQLFRDK